MLVFQCRGGGWAAFDWDVTDRWLEDVPCADHSAVLDPECSDLTARVLELLSMLHFDPRDPRDPRVMRALRYLQRSQEADGSWYGRWGVNVIYGTWQALRGLAILGYDMREPWLLRARDWLETCQNEDGSWGRPPGPIKTPPSVARGPAPLRRRRGR